MARSDVDFVKCFSFRRTGVFENRFLMTVVGASFKYAELSPDPELEVGVVIGLRRASTREVVLVDNVVYAVTMLENSHKLSLYSASAYVSQFGFSLSYVRGLFDV